MQAFLDALLPSVREELQRALDATPDGHHRLREVAEPYFDAQGDWPREPFTADWVARTFIHQSQVYYWSDFTPSYGAAGVSDTVVAGVAGAGVSVAVGQGAVILGSQMVERYWADSLAYAAGLDPKLVKGFITAWNRTTALTGWKKLGFAAPEPNVFTQFVDDALGKTLEREIHSQITGLASHVAWRGARSALNHTDRATMGDRVQEVGWTRNYLDRFVLNQQQTMRETVRRIVDDGLTRGHSSEVIAGRLQQTWMLPPRLSQAVDNYRRGLEEQKLPRGRINTFVNRYIEKLKLHRAETLSRTESMTLFNLGRDRAWQDAVRRGEMPLDTVKMWVTAKDELVCKICRPMDGLTVPLGETFLTRDGNIIVPSVHPNCRCMLLPVRNVADFSGAEFIFPVREVAKHLGGPSGKDDHPSGTSQDTHGDGGSAGQPYRDKLTALFTNQSKWDDLSQMEQAAVAVTSAYTATGLVAIGAAVAFPAGRQILRYADMSTLRLTRLPSAPPAPLSTTKMPTYTQWQEFTAKAGDVFLDRKAVRIRRADGSVRTEYKGLDEIFNITRQKLLSTVGYRGGSMRLDRAYHGSVVTNPQIHGMQHAADEAFGLKANTAHFAKRSDAQKAIDDALDGVGYGPYVKAQNDQMQEMLKAAGITEVPVARGMKINAAQARAMGLKPVTSRADVVSGNPVWQRTKVDLQPLSSFTTDPEVARQFATGITPSGSLDSLALLMRRKVGSDEVFSNWALGPGAKSWEEWVIKGGSKDWDVVAVSPRLLRDNDFFKALWDVTAATVGKSLDVASGASSSFDEMVKHLGGSSGKEDHPSGSPQTAHAGGDPFSEKVWDFAAYALSRGEVRDRSDLNATMRKRNQRASRPLRHQRNGKIMDFSVRQLGFMTEGYGFRLGNNNHIRSFANRMMEGQDLFQHEGRRDPILLMVYEDGAQVLDGKHRLAAAQMAGVRKVPVQVARVRKPMPKPETLRQEWDELRRNLVRYQHANNEIHPDKPSEPFKVRSPYQFEKTFNDWMATRSALRDEERFRELGVERGTKPKRFRRSG